MQSSIVQLVDSIPYVESNCFQHQLLSALRHKVDVVQVPVDRLSQFRASIDTHHVVSCLKMRTLHRVQEQLRRSIGDCPLVVYEQDPWHAYMDDSPWKGVFESVKQRFNLSFVAVTTRWWADYMNAHGIPSKFVKMWMLPEYCDRGPALSDRNIELGFIGSLHPHRAKLFDFVESYGLSINTSGGYDYPSYLKALHRMKVYIHSEDCPITVNGQVHNLNNGLWVREIEVAARGCISIRNWGSEHETYVDSNVNSVFLYDDPQEIPRIIERIRLMDPTELQNKIDSTVEHIRSTDAWSETADVLIKG